MNILDFIQRVLIDQFKEIHQGEGHLCISLSLICQGIEFLGACLDSEPFSAKGLSAPRFRKAIYDLFPANYHPFNQGSGRPLDLYENLRCGLLPIFLSGSRVEVVHRSEQAGSTLRHLEVREIRGMSRLVLVLEDLFEDYEKACRQIISRIVDGRLRGWKFSRIR